jgi:GH35 family endo-1,4-beta-xylanase
MFLMTVSLLHADNKQVLPDGGQTMLKDEALFKTPFQGSGEKFATKSEVVVKDMPFTKALQVTITEKPAYDRDVQLSFHTVQPIAEGDVLYMEVWARILSTDDTQNNKGEIRLVLEQSQKPWKKLIWMKQDVSTSWTHYQIPVASRAMMEAGNAQVAFRLGGRKQVIELGGLRLLNYKQAVDSKALPHSDMDYMGMEPNAPWRSEADKRIEQYRKGDLSVTLVDLSGQPVQDASVHVQMTRHAFAFGSVYNTRWFNGSNATTADGKKYRQMFKELFNIGVDEGAMKWPGWENPKAWDGINAALSWMAQNNIAVRGHCLVWGSFLRMPKDIPLIIDNPEALKHRIVDHIYDAVGATRDKVVAWDVVNEPQSHNDVFKNLDVEVMADWFKAAHQANPDIRLTLNETTSASMDGGMDIFEKHAKMLLDKGAPITALGFQSHFSQLGMPIPQVYAILNRFAKLGLQLEITEFDYSGVDEAMQAAFTRDYLTICFSHPKVVSFLFWGFWEGSHWQPDRALFNKDWSIKPNGQAYKDLVFGKWWTDESLKTDAQGSINTRGFLGDYTLTITAKGKTMTRTLSLPREGCVLKVVVP